MDTPCDPLSSHQLFESYVNRGIDFPSREDLVALRSIYHQLQKLDEPGQRASIRQHTLTGWLHYEHGMALQGTYPDQADKRYEQSLSTFDSLYGHTATRSEEKTLSICARELLIRYTQSELRQAPDADEQRLKTIGQLGALIHLGALETERPVPRGTAGLRGVLSEIAFSAVGLLPRDEHILILPASLRQDYGKLNAEGKREAVDINAVRYHKEDRAIVTENVTPIQVKHREFPPYMHAYLQACPEYFVPYDEHIALAYADRVLGLLSMGDYSMFSGHLQRFARTGETTAYLDQVSDNFMDLVTNTPSRLSA